MRITNKGQFSNLSIRNTTHQSIDLAGTKPTPDFTVKVKPLTSRSWVTVSKRSKGNKNLDSKSANYRLKQVGNLWVEIEKPRVSETVKQQQKLIKELRKQFEERQERIRAQRALRKTTIQHIHKVVDGVMVNTKVIPNFNGNAYKKVG